MFEEGQKDECDWGRMRRRGLWGAGGEVTGADRRHRREEGRIARIWGFIVEVMAIQYVVLSR